MHLPTLRGAHRRLVGLRSAAAGAATVDFLVIGAAKAGTTTLWRHLSSHPRVAVPVNKETDFWQTDAFHQGLERYLAKTFREPTRGRKLGSLTPECAAGTEQADVEEIADRICSLAPRVRLVMLLRDPAARARSEWKMETRRGTESRSFLECVEDLLAPEALERARRCPTRQTAYIISGEYRRILETYLRRFPREQLCVLLSADYETRPQDVLDRVHKHLGVPPHQPPDVAVKHFQGGTRSKIDAATAQDLRQYLDEYYWPTIKSRRRDRPSFHANLEFWNTVPEPEVLSDEDENALALLSAHYAGDVPWLRETFGLSPAWGAPRDARRPSA